MCTSLKAPVRRHDRPGDGHGRFQETPTGEQTRVRSLQAGRRTVLGDLINEYRQAAPCQRNRRSRSKSSFEAVQLQGLVMMAVSPLSARIATGRGPKTTPMLGAVIVATGYGLSTVPMSAIWRLVLVSCIVGAGVGFA